MVAPQTDTHLLRLVQFPSDPVNIHDALCRVLVTEDLGVELAQSLCLVLSQRVLHDECVDLGDEPVVGLYILVRFGEVSVKPTGTPTSANPFEYESNLLLNLGAQELLSLLRLTERCDQTLISLLLLQHHLLCFRHLGARLHLRDLQLLLDSLQAYVGLGQ